MKYRKIDADSYSFEQLREDFTPDQVLLEVRKGRYDPTCSVASYVRARHTIQVYCPSHILASLGSRSFQALQASSHAQWRELLAGGNAYIDIQNESFFPCEYEHPDDQLEELLLQAKGHPDQTELYFSGDRPNFYGPLECDFMQWWLEQNPAYHLGDISRRQGDFEISETGTLLSYEGDERDTLSLPAGIRRIGLHALAHCRAKRIILPEQVETIGQSAFFQCRELEQLDLPDTLTDIEEYAFFLCSSLKEVRIPKGTAVHPKAFAGCPVDTI